MEDARSIKVGDIVRHFKGVLYSIVSTEAYWHEDSDEKERMVVYWSHATGKTCIRPYNMFMSEVDHKKYPNVSQKYRFEKLTDQLDKCQKGASKK